MVVYHVVTPLGYVVRATNSVLFSSFQCFVSALVRTEMLFVSTAECMWQGAGARTCAHYVQYFPLPWVARTPIDLFDFALAVSNRTRRGRWVSPCQAIPTAINVLHISIPLIRPRSVEALGACCRRMGRRGAHASLWA